MKTEPEKLRAHTPTAPSRRHARVLQKLQRTKKSTIVGVMILLIVAIFLIANWPQANQNQPARQQDTSSPQYQAVLPSGKAINDLGGWKKRTPPNGATYYDYQDSIGNVPINVSQQPLPKDFQSNTNQKVADLAKSYNATSKLTVQGQTVYIGISAKGPQSVIFTKDNLLIFIMSERKISNDSWKRYITSLGIPSSTDKTQY